VIDVPHPTPSERKPQRTREVREITLTSSAFREGTAISKTHTADGGDVSPGLAWGDPPAGTESFAIICHDPDAPSGAFVHWLVWNIPGTARTLGAVLPPMVEVNEIRQGRNGFGRMGYAGPNPPPDEPHRYVFKIYALDARPHVHPGANHAQLIAAISGHVLAEGTLTGIYTR
jgi:Raf kinase inhibitor-like YbhB/YbcL family protein